MNKNYSTEIRETFGKKYLKVFFANQDEIESARQFLSHLNSVAKVNITESKSSYHPGSTLTIMPKPMYNVEEVEKEVIQALNDYFQHKIILPEQTVIEAHFSSIKKIIIEELEKAVNTIYVCVAWFTDKEILKILESKQEEGVVVKVMVYDDGINMKKGVDLSKLSHKYQKADRHGIMHRKYAVIDNHVVISGSYNWTGNAEKKNDENIQIIQDWNNANIHTRQFLDDWSEK